MNVTIEPDRQSPIMLVQNWRIAALISGVIRKQTE
jgi:hypothetical protein